MCIRTLLFHFLLLFAISGSGQVEVRNPIISPAMDPIVTTETIVRDGVTFVRNSVPIPTGKVESSGLLLEKILPQEVTLNSEFTYEYRVQNLTPHHLINVAIHDKTDGAGRGNNCGLCVAVAMCFTLFDSAVPRSGSGCDQRLIRA